MTDKYEDLRKAAQKATLGPWAVGKYLGQRSDEWSVFLRTPKGENGLPVVTTMFGLANATFIAAANPAAILELLAERDKLREALEDLAEAGEDAWGAGRPCVKLGRAALNQETPQ